MRINYLDLFSGIGGFAKGLQDAGFQYNNHYFSEIDKYAIQIYKKHFPTATAVGDVSGIKGESFGKIDLITFGFPCQDLSIAGNRAGMEGARSGLFFEATRLIRELKPSIFIFENVKGLFSADEGTAFEGCLREIADIGLYECEWQLLNTSWFLPQNRERVYFIGHLGERSGQKVFPIGEGNEGTCINIKRLGHNNKFRRYNQTYDSSGIVESLDTSGGGEHQPCVVVKDEYIISDGYPSKENKAVSECPCLRFERQFTVKPVLTPGRKEKRQNGRRMKENGEDSFTLTGQDQHGVMITEATNKGYDVAKEGDSINLSNPKSKTRRGRVGKGVAQTLDTGMQQHTLSGSKIRRLTPRECERLQGFPDGWTDGVSDSQKYRCLGNAVSVPVVKEIGRRLLC